MTLTHRAAAIPLLLSLALLALYLAFPTKVFYWDGIVFAQAIEDATRASISLAHPNHLVYNFVGYGFYKLLRGFGADVRAITALQILNSIFSAACATLLFLILRDTLRSNYFSVCLTLLFALSATWWKFSTDANAYIASVLFLLLSFYLVLPDRKPRPLLLALTFFLAMCFHQLAVIAFPVFALGVYLEDGALAIKQRVTNALVFTVASFVLIVGTYALVFYLATGSLDVTRLLRWTASYSPDADTRFALWSNLMYSLRGEVRLFFGGRINLLSRLVSPTVALLIGLFTSGVLSLVVAVGWNLATLKRRWRGIRLSPRQKTVLLLSLLWAVAYLVFLFFWLPQNTFYRLFYLPALIMMLGLALSAFPQEGYRRTYATALFVIAVGLANFLFLIYPFSHVEKYPPLEFALQMNREWPPGTVIYYGSPSSDAALIRYFNPGTQWRPLPAELPPFEDNVWLETSAIDRISATSAGSDWLEMHTRLGSLRELNGAYRIRFIAITSPVWYIDP
jgi:hypothetical protein